MTATATRRRPGVDPRVDARRDEVRRSAGRRRLRLLVVVFFVCAIPTSVYLAIRSPVLDVDAIDAAATPHVSLEEIVIASGIDARDPLVFVHPDDVARRVEEAIPWVASVDVQRRWPGTVRIRVTEHVATAVVRASDGTTAIVASSGRVLARAATGGPKFEITGTATTPPAGERLTPAAAAAVPSRLPPALALRIVGLVLDGRDATLTPAPGAGPEIRLGPLTDLTAKLASAVAVIDRLGADGLEGVTYIDVRVPSSPVAGSAAVGAGTAAAADRGSTGATPNRAATGGGASAGGLTAVPTSIPDLDAPLRGPDR